MMPDLKRLIAVVLATIAVGFAIVTWVESHPLQFEVKLTLDGAGTEMAELRWLEGQEKFDDRLVMGFPLPRGSEQVIRRKMPHDFTGLRFDPGDGAGAIGIRYMRLQTVIPIVDFAWSATRGLGRLTYWNVESSGVEDGVWKVVGKRDPQIEIKDFAGVRRIIRWRLIGFVVIVLAPVFGFFWFLVSPSGRRNETVVAAGAIGMNRKRLAIGVVYAAYLIALGFGGWFAYRAFAIDGTDLSPGHMVLLDFDGSPLTESSGDFRVRLDPFTLYRLDPMESKNPYEIGPHGFRGPFDSKDSRPLVFVTGGSSAFGFLVFDEKKTLVGRLRETRPDLQVVNAALSSFLSGQELAYMVHHLDAHRPRHYVAFTGWNDLFLQRYPKPAPVMGFNQELYRNLTDAIRFGCESCPVPVRKNAPLTDDEVSRLAHGLASNLIRMNAFAKARGANFLAVIQPDAATRRTMTSEESTKYSSFFDGRPQFPEGIGGRYASFAEEAARLARAEGVDVMVVFDEQPFKEAKGTLFLDQVHLNETGSDLVARLVASRLKANLR